MELENVEMPKGKTDREYLEYLKGLVQDIQNAVKADMSVKNLLGVSHNKDYDEVLEHLNKLYLKVLQRMQDELDTASDMTTLYNEWENYLSDLDNRGEISRTVYYDLVDEGWNKMEESFKLGAGKEL